MKLFNFLIWVPSPEKKQSTQSRKLKSLFLSKFLILIVDGYPFCHFQVKNKIHPQYFQNTEFEDNQKLQ